MLSLARQSLARSSLGRPGSILFDMELEGFESVLHEDAATFERLQSLLRALRSGGSNSSSSYAERLAADAAEAAAEAAAAADAAFAAAAAGQPLPPAADAAATDAASTVSTPQSQSPTAQQAFSAAAAVPSELQAFVKMLAAKGHDVWLRTGRPAPPPTDDPDSGSGADETVISGSSLSALSAAAEAAAAVGRRVSSGGGSGGGSAPLSPPAHTFVVARAPGDGGTLFIVDPSFRDLFSASTVAAAADPVYGALVGALPDVVVGTAAGVADLVAFCCQQMERAFAASGTPLPPWRDAAIMLAVWFPEAADDVPLSDLQTTAAAEQA